MRKMLCLVGVLFYLNSSYSQNSGNGETWYKINTKGEFVTKITARGSYAEHNVIVHIVNKYWNTAEVQYISEFNYNHTRVKLEWGYVGSGSDRYLAVKNTAVTSTSAGTIILTDIINPDLDYVLEAIDESLVTPITPKKIFHVDEWNGNVGIGTDLSSNPNNYKLAVKGTIGAQKVKVENSSLTWSDFVFYKDYNLPTLKQVEQHIKEKGHLKDIPSAKEVKQNGIYLAEMNAKLLQKIEELTLYTIQQEKKIQSQDKINTELLQRVLKLEQILN
ncbi:hypothetical protein [Neotamlana laminarinivorans]|uniref:Peptidase S74 domain-containing protein n=1 Tax=Neotamlana laminarinivorans TaxID=2883124 RepID=A0A9X1HXT2_9FLAO|nr:hypothetical protein [Tamlana laminarinivorans]MCB4797225.1 hypothetical protein [Tamlana laminarinivorans]